MIHQRFKNRLKVPNTVAAVAAIVLLFGAIAGPASNPDNTHTHGLRAERTPVEDLAPVREPARERTGVSTPQRAAENFNISSLIFRF